MSAALFVTADTLPPSAGRALVRWLDKNECPHWIWERSPLLLVGPFLFYVALCPKDRVDQLRIVRGRAVPIGPRVLRIRQPLRTAR